MYLTEKALAPHSSTLAWKIPWTQEPGRLQSMGSLRVGHDWATSLSLFTFMHWRRKWQPTPVFLPWVTLLYYPVVPIFLAVCLYTHCNLRLHLCHLMPAMSVCWFPCVNVSRGVIWLKVGDMLAWLFFVSHPVPRTVCFVLRNHSKNTCWVKNTVGYRLPWWPSA